MVFLGQAPDDLRVGVGRQVRRFLPGQANDQAGEIFLGHGGLVSLSPGAGQVDAGGLLPQLHAGRCLDQAVDIGAPNPGGSL